MMIAAVAAAVQAWRIGFSLRACASMCCVTVVPPSVFGDPVLRSEDPRFLRGLGTYLENVQIPGALRAVFVRSIFPHAVLNGVEGVGDARGMPGVAAVFTASDLEIPAQPPSGNVEMPAGSIEEGFEREALASERLRYVGEPFAVVIAETLGQALDAAEVVRADADPLPHVTDPEAAMADGSPLLWPELGTNIAHTFSSGWDADVSAGADVVVRGRFVNQRVAPVPMETNGIAVVPGSDGTYTVWVSSQVPFDVRADLAELLGVERSSVRAVAPDVGGGFGAKLLIYPEYLVVAKAAQILGRPVRWSESRSESMVSLNHGRAQVQRVEVGATRQGRLVGMRLEVIGDAGAYPVGAFLVDTTAEMSAGVYDWPKIAYRGWSVVTNTVPIMAYRGAGRPEATALVERAVDMVAAELSLDPAELRRHNLVPRDAFPYRTASGTTYDTGDYERALDEALSLSRYDERRQEQRRRRETGDGAALGIGVSTYVEVTGFPSRDFAEVTIEPDVTVTVRTGVSPHGQGHETSLAQIAAGVLSIPFESVRVVHSDTAEVERGEGTWGSRSLQVAGSLVAERAGDVVSKGLELAAAALETDVADVVGPVDGAFTVAGAPERSVSWADLVPIAEPGALSAKGRRKDPGSTFPFGAHVAVVEVDLETGSVEIVSHVAVDDCGRILNPLLVAGQQHGGIAQGIAQALYEEVVYDEDGTPVTGDLTTYLMPSAADLPGFTVSNTETPTDVNSLGVKGIGEAGTIGSTPAVQNAVVDALAHMGLNHVDMPCSPERVIRAILEARDRARD
jgi:carbon-monoxide dehydrogenase large subunit